MSKRKRAISGFIFFQGGKAQIVFAFQDRALLTERHHILLVGLIKVQQLYFLFVSMKVEQRAVILI